MEDFLALLLLQDPFEAANFFAFRAGESVVFIASVAAFTFLSVWHIVKLSKKYYSDSTSPPRKGTDTQPRGGTP